MPDCNSCSKSGSPAAVPYFVHEAEMYRAERLNGRLWILCILLVCTLVLSNMAWVVYEFGGDTAVSAETVFEDAAG